MTDVWSGTFTFLLTDIEGSTRLWEVAPAEMARALVRHDDLIASVVPAHGGRLVRSRGEGDSSFAVFDEAIAAAACAVELQRAFAAEPWPPSARIRVRMALHTGPAQARGDDYFGQGVNRAARIRSIAHGGQLLISDDVHAVIADVLPADSWVRDMGLHRLKDLTQPERIWQLGHQDLQSEFPPLRSLDVRRHNLPVQLTTFVGRELDVLGVRKRLESAALVTLTGLGGIGKTRLAVQTAAELVDEFADGVWLVELSAISDPQDVAPAIATVLGVRDEATDGMLRPVADHLLDRELLLVLDNCEHVVEETAVVVHALLQAAAGVRVLATSREPLRVYGESVYDVPTMELPGAAASFSEEAMESDAVRLFVDRAELADREFTLGASPAAVVQICRRLEGIPLAIELAAALVRTSAPEQIAERLSDRLNTLASGPRTVPERHRTLRAAIDSTYEHLSPEERELVARLTAFTGGFTIDAARAVCTSERIAESDVEQLIGRLVELSLLQTRTTPIGIRFAMLETINDYARERDADLATEALERHLAWAVEYSTSVAKTFRGPSTGDAMARMTEDYDNMRAALNRWIDTRPDDASRIIEALFMFWSQERLREGVEWCRRGIVAANDPARRARLGIYAGGLASAQGDPTAVALLEEHIAAARKLHEPETVALGLNVLAGTAIQSGRIADAKAMASEALTHLRRGGNPRNIVQALNVLGVAATIEGDEAAAYAYYEDALAVSRDIGMQETISRLLLNLGNLAVGRSDFDRARRYYTEARELAQSIGDVIGGSAALTNLGVIAKATGDYREARTTLDEALAFKRELGDGRGIAIALQGLADLDRIEGRYASSQRRMKESLEICRELEFSIGMIQGLEALSGLYVEIGDAETGLVLAAAAEAARNATGQRRSPDDTRDFERVVTALREMSSADDTDRWWKQGSSMPLMDAVDRALHVPAVTDA